MPTRTPEEALDIFEHSVEDAMFRFSLYVSVFLSLLAIVIIIANIPAIETFVTRLREFVLPWLLLFAIVSIGRELWMSRVFMEHIQFGKELEKFVRSRPVRRKPKSKKRRRK